MSCSQCGAAIEVQPHRCAIDENRPGAMFTGRTEGLPVGLPAIEERTIFVDLADLDLPWQMNTLDDRATVVSHLYERFVPYADDGWVWERSPSDPALAEWVYGERDGRVRLEGAKLRSRRVDLGPAQRRWRAVHPVSLHRLRQLAQRPWTAEPASKLWRRLDPSQPALGRAHTPEAEN
ncbi:MAG TPA: hypothetical protein VFH48_19530 [Chloroflexota bacterium]|nr:hypothetical protein [Chloroflexota bacterium]